MSNLGPHNFGSGPRTAGPPMTATVKMARDKSSIARNLTQSHILQSGAEFWIDSRGPPGSQRPLELLEAATSGIRPADS